GGLMREFTKEFETSFDYLTGFRAAVERGPDRPALTCPSPERTWTYAELDGESNRLARALRSAGLTQGDVLMASLFNCPEFVFCFLGCLKAGVVFSPINPRLSPREIALHLEDSKPAIYVHDAAITPLVREALARSTHAPGLALVVGSRDDCDAGIDYERFVRDHSTADVSPEGGGPDGEIVR